MQMISLKSAHQDTAIITFTSSGYIDITQNLCNSNTQNNVNYSINIFCLDEESLNYDFGSYTNNINFSENEVEGLEKTVENHMCCMHGL